MLNPKLWQCGAADRTRAKLFVEILFKDTFHKWFGMGHAKVEWIIGFMDVAARVWNTFPEDGHLADKEAGMFISAKSCHAILVVLEKDTITDELDKEIFEAIVNLPVEAAKTSGLLTPLRVLAMGLTNNVVWSEKVTFWTKHARKLEVCLPKLRRTKKKFGDVCNQPPIPRCRRKSPS